VSGADGIGDTEGKAAMGSGERAGRQASFKSRVALPMSEGFAPEAYRLSPGSDADQGYIKSGGEQTAHRRSRKR